MHRTKIEFTPMSHERSRFFFFLMLMVRRFTVNRAYLGIQDPIVGMLIVCVVLMSLVFVLLLGFDGQSHPGAVELTRLIRENGRFTPCTRRRDQCCPLVDWVNLIGLRLGLI